MKMKYPDYKNSIANLSCSIMKYFGAEAPNSTLSAADMLLQGNCKNIVTILLDGMGTDILEKHLSPDGFFRSHLVTSYSSTFPPTTVASTTAMDSGLYPNQSAWLGWTGYFGEIDRNIFYFLNMDADTMERIEGMNVAYTYAPYRSIRDRLLKVGVEGHFVASFRPPFYKSFDAICCRVKELCDSTERKYIYAYWEDPDDTMHKKGVSSEEAKAKLRELERRTQQLASELEDTLLIVTADHGQIDIETRTLTDYPDICDCLIRMPSLEIRCPNFFVKEEKRTLFEEAFQKHFGQDFLLMKKEEVLEKQLFGEGKNHERFDSMIGDYLAVGIGNVGINNVEMEFKGHHAGLTEEEMTIPLIAIRR